MDRSAFYAALRTRDITLFGTRLSEKQVTGMEGILDAFASYGDGSKKTLAYALATAYGEVGSGMSPVREGFASTDAGARRAVNNLAKKRGPRSAVARYAQPQPPYGHVYYGRGFVQLTWKENYAASSADAGVDIVKDPDAVLDPEIGARLLIKGLIDGRWNGARKGIAHYLPPNGKDDLRNARRTVNVTDKWEEFAEFYKQFMKAIDAAGGVPVLRPEPVARIEPVGQNIMTKDAQAVIDDAAAIDRVSTTEIMAIGTGATGAANAIKETVEAVNDASVSIMSAGPWVLVGLMTVGFGVYIWRERRRKKKMGVAAKAGA